MAAKTKARRATSKELAAELKDTKLMGLKGEYCEMWSVAYVTGFLAAKGFPDGCDETPEKKAAEKEAVAAMRANPFWGRRDFLGRSGK